MVLTNFYDEAFLQNRYPACINLREVNGENTRTMCEICSRSTIKTPEWLQWRVNMLPLGLQETQHEKYPYAEYFWSVFSRIRSEYGEILRPYLSKFCPNAERCWPGKLRIRSLFRQWSWNHILLFDLIC